MGELELVLSSKNGSSSRFHPDPDGHVVFLVRAVHL